MYNLLGTAMAAVKHDDLSLAFDFVSYAAPTEHDAYVSLDTGKIYWTSDPCTPCVTVPTIGQSPSHPG
jgi:hypothetical protein